MEITLEDFKAGMMRLKPEVDKDPRERTFGGFVYSPVWFSFFSHP